MALLAQPLALYTCYFFLCLSLLSEPTPFSYTFPTSRPLCSVSLFVTFAFPLLLSLSVGEALADSSHSLAVWQERRHFFLQRQQEDTPLRKQDRCFSHSLGPCGHRHQHVSLRGFFTLNWLRPPPSREGWAIIATVVRASWSACSERLAGIGSVECPMA